VHCIEARAVNTFPRWERPHGLEVSLSHSRPLPRRCRGASHRISIPGSKMATMELLCLGLCRKGHRAEDHKTQMQQHSSCCCGVTKAPAGVGVIYGELSESRGSHALQVQNHPLHGTSRSPEAQSGVHPSLGSSRIKNMFLLPLVPGV